MGHREGGGEVKLEKCQATPFTRSWGQAWQFTVHQDSIFTSLSSTFVVLGRLVNSMRADIIMALDGCAGRALLASGRLYLQNGI
jgi:hypothetical protein